MSKIFCRKHISFCRKVISVVMALCFSLFTVVGPAGSQTFGVLGTGLTSGLAADGLGTSSHIACSVAFQPPVLRGMTVHPENPLLFDFIVDRGQDKIGNELLKDESTKLIKYFLTSMTIPDKDAWVNLSPTEKDRIIPDALGQTEMGRAMLEQDYVLKQLAASLTNPDTELGKKYWDEVNRLETLEAGRLTLGKNNSTSVQPPTSNDFNKVWIVPDGATVVEKDGFAYITQSKLKVMLDEDYVDGASPLTAQVGAYCNTPLQKNTGCSVDSLSTQVFRELILPKLIEEVNAGKNFAATRQVYQSVILAAWYKRALKDSLLGRIYADKSKIAGVETDVKDIKQKVYELYLEAFKKGAYNVIKEEPGPDGDMIPRKYFSGGQIMASAPIVVSSPAAVNGVRQEINQSERVGRIALVAASTVENFDEAEVLAASAPVNVSDKPANLARRGFLKAAGAMGAAAGLGLLPHDGNAADFFTTENADFFVTSKKQDTFEKIIEEMIGKSVLSKLSAAQRKEILETAFEKFKQENPNIQFEAIDKPFAPGINFAVKDINYYTTFAVYTALSDVVAQQTLWLPGQDIPVYYVQPKVMLPYMGLANAFGKYGIIMNINHVHFLISKGKGVFLASKPDIAGTKHYLSALFEGKSQREAVEAVVIDALTHELAHIALWNDFSLPIQSTETWIAKISSQAAWPIARQEVWAYLIQIAQSKMSPRVTINALMPYADPGNYGEPTVLASRIVIWSILDELGFGDYLADEEIKRQESQEERFSWFKKSFYRFFFSREWANKQDLIFVADQTESADKFLATKTAQEIKEAAGRIFERLSGRNIPQIPTGFQVPEEVFKALGAASGAQALTSAASGVETGTGEAGAILAASPVSVQEFREFLEKSSWNKPKIIVKSIIDDIRNKLEASKILIQQDFTAEDEEYIQDYLTVVKEDVDDDQSRDRSFDQDKLSRTTSNFLEYWMNKKFDNDYRVNKRLLLEKLFEESMLKYAQRINPKAIDIEAARLAMSYQLSRREEVDYKKILAGQKVTLFGESHWLMAATEEMIDKMAVLKANGVTHIGMEMIPAKLQHLLDRYDGENIELRSELESALEQEQQWGKKYVLIIDAAKKLGLQVTALDSDPTVIYEQLKQYSPDDTVGRESFVINYRNKDIVNQIKKTVDNTSNKMVVLIGLGHVAGVKHLLAQGNVTVKSFVLISVTEQDEGYRPITDWKGAADAIRDHELAGERFMVPSTWSDVDGIVYLPYSSIDDFRRKTAAKGLVFGTTNGNSAASPIDQALEILKTYGKYGDKTTVIDRQQPMTFDKVEELIRAGKIIPTEDGKYLRYNDQMRRSFLPDFWYHGTGHNPNFARDILFGENPGYLISNSRIKTNLTRDESYAKSYLGTDKKGLLLKFDFSGDRKLDALEYFWINAFGNSVDLSKPLPIFLLTIESKYDILAEFKSLTEDQMRTAAKLLGLPMEDVRLFYETGNRGSRSVASNEVWKLESGRGQDNFTKGGIDFDPSKLNLQIKRDGHGVPLPLPQQDLENINIKGLYPVILNILPVNAQTLPILGQLQKSSDAVI